MHALAGAALLAIGPVPMLPGQEAPSAAPCWQLPVPRGELVIEVAGGTAQPSLADVIVEYAELAALDVFCAPESRMMLEGTASGLQSSVTVPPADVQAYVETLLVQNGFAVTLVRETEPRLLRIDSLRTERRQHVGMARFVPADRTDVMEEHPAMLVKTVLPLPNVHVKEVCKSMNALSWRGEEQRVMPAGADTVILVGFGPSVAADIELLRTLAERAR